MQWVTHSLVGVALQRSVERIVPNKPIRIIMVIGFGCLSHVVLDDLARMTYHPRVSRIADWTPFLVGWCTAVTIVGIIVFWHFRRYALGMLAAIIPDADWVIFRPLAWAGCALPWWYEGRIHDSVRSLPILSHFNRLSELLPDLRENAFGITGETVVACMMVWFLMQKKVQRADNYD